MFVIRRNPHNPVLSPRHEHPWETEATFNPSVIRRKDGWHMFYRALSSPAALVTPYAGQSSVGEAFSEDGVHFVKRRQALMAQEPWEQYGCEDPRATEFEGATYLSYTALGGYPFNKDNIKVGIVVAKDGANFTERHLVTPFNAKAFVLFPERVNGKVAALLSVHTDEPPSEMCLALADSVEEFWSPAFWETWYRDWRSHALPLRRSGEDQVEVGSVPLLTEKGWLIFYSYIEDYFKGGDRIFSVEAALLDRDDPAKIIRRTESIMIPEEVYELYGIAPNIVFPTSATFGDGGMLDLWYGAADTVCAKASMKLDGLLDALEPTASARAFVRAPENPILAPRGTGFDGKNVFNAGAIELEGSVHLLYRAMDQANTSSFGLAVSKDGIHIDERLAEPAYIPRAEFELKKGDPNGNSGCEDPRIVRIGDTLHMTYTAYDGTHAPSGALSSISVNDFLARDFGAWTEPYLVTPPGVDDKDVALLPETVNGEYLFYHRISSQICADALSELSPNKRVNKCIEIMGPRRGMWDGTKIGIACPPLRVGGKWLMIYHGVSRHATYRLGAALLDADGTTLLARTADPIFEPVEPYEKEGEVGNVVFSCGAVVRGDTLFLYYGGADRVLGVATASVARIMDALS